MSAASFSPLEFSQTLSHHQRKQLLLELIQDMTIADLTDAERQTLLCHSLQGLSSLKQLQWAQWLIAQVRPSGADQPQVLHDLVLLIQQVEMNEMAYVLALIAERVRQDQQQDQQRKT